jgi:hypothetical protein
MKRNLIPNRVLWWPAAALMALASCTTPKPPPPAPPPKKSAPVVWDPMIWDYRERRIEGRETASPWPGVVVHADRQTKVATGVVVLEGRVYVDATGWKEQEDSIIGGRFYCDKVEWDAASHVLVLSGSPIAESQRHLFRAIAADAIMKLHEEGNFETDGMTKTDIGRGNGLAHEAN